MKKKTRRSIDPNTIVLIRQIVMGILIFGFVGGVILGVWYVSRIPALTIERVVATGGDTLDISTIEQIAFHELQGTYFGLIPRQFSWLYPHEQVVAVVSQVPRVETVTVTVDGTTLLLQLTEHQPAALWCAGVATSTCVFLNESGYAYALAPELQGGGLVRYVSLATPPMVDIQPWATEDFMQLQILTDTLLRYAWPISHVEVDAARDIFLHIVGGGEFKMTLTQSLEESVANLLTVVTADQFKHVMPGNFQYIDLRFGNKVFVNEEMPMIMIDSGTSTTSDVATTSIQDLADIDSND